MAIKVPQYGQEGNFPGGEDVFSYKYKHKPYADAIREHVKEALPLYREAKKEGLFNEKTIGSFERLIGFIQ